MPLMGFNPHMVRIFVWVSNIQWLFLSHRISGFHTIDGLSQHVLGFNINWLRIDFLGFNFPMALRISILGFKHYLARMSALGFTFLLASHIYFGFQFFIGFIVGVVESGDGCAIYSIRQPSRISFLVFKVFMAS